MEGCDTPANAISRPLKTLTTISIVKYRADDNTIKDLLSTDVVTHK